MNHATGLRALPLLTMVLGGVIASGCQSPGNAAGQAPADPAQPVTSASSATMSATKSATNEACMVDENATTVDSREFASTDPATGKPMIRVGQSLAAGTPSVPLSELLVRPESFEGKTVRVEGEVSTMCTHRRGWFAIVGPGGTSKSALRVITSPRFLVPRGAVGLTGRAEGTIEVRELGEDARQHQEASHGLREATNRVVLLHATGAEFL
jgi:hypothetical protein